MAVPVTTIISGITTAASLAESIGKMSSIIGQEISVTVTEQIVSGGN